MTGPHTPDPHLARITRRFRELGRENERMFAELSEMQRRFRGMARAVWRVQEDERRRLARELHDGVGQTLTALRHRLDRLPETPERAQALELLQSSLEDVREMSRLLRPPVLDDLGLAAALNWLIRRVRSDSDLDITLEVGALEETGRLDPELETLVFRIVQEALNNIVRHAEAGRAGVRLFKTGDRLQLRINDDGHGFDPSAVEANAEQRGIGLAGMRDRVALFGGEVAINSAPGRGATIHATLPVGNGA